MRKKVTCVLIAALIVLVALCGCAAFSKSADIEAVSNSLLEKAQKNAPDAAAKEPEEPQKTDGPKDTQEPDSSEQPNQTEQPDATLPPVNNALTYTDSRYGFTLEFPKNWEGKYRVEQYDGGIVVYFVPSVPIEDGMGRFFTLAVNPDPEEQDFYDNAKWIHTKRADYLYGGPTDVTYQQSDPEYKTFVRMNKDVDAIMSTLKDYV